MSVKHKPLLGFIDNWTIVPYEEVGLSNEPVMRYYVEGVFRDHPRYRGRFGRTSTVVVRRGNHIETRNSRYLLGEPAKGLSGRFQEF